MPKRGTSFPPVRKEAYAPAIADTLNRQLGESHQAVKTIMRWTGAGERTVKNWLSARTGPSGQYLLGLIRHSDEVLDVLLRLTGRREIAATKHLLQIRNVLAETVARMDLLMGPETEH